MPIHEEALALHGDAGLEVEFQPIARNPYTIT
jgi:hypothetical protein